MKIVIIGAGIAGLSIGWRLAQAGAETLILDRGQPGRGATWASAGMIAGTAESGDAPEAEMVFARQSMVLWPKFAKELEEVSGARLSYRRDGALLVARTPGEAKGLSARAEMAGLDYISAEAARRKVPGLAPGILGALWAPEDAQVDNRALGQALATAFVRAGGKLLVNEAAVLVEGQPGGGAAVRTPFSVHHGDAVLLATGAWTGQLGGLPAEALPPVRPVKGEVIALTPREGAVLPGPLVWGDGPTYLVPRGGRLFVGATVAAEAGFDTTLTEEARVQLHSRAAALIPEVAGWRCDEHWAGLRPGSPDGLPIIGQTALEGVFVASGQYRNGILFAPAMAETVPSLILEQRVAPEIAAFDPRRFQN
jgi:glycine oxidase